MPSLIGMQAIGHYEDNENVPVPSGAYNYFIFSKADGLYTIDPDGVIKKVGRDDLVFGLPLEEAYGSSISTTPYIMYLATVDGQICWNMEWKDGNDGTAIHDDWSGEINAITAKTTLVDNDITIIEDSASTYAKKKVTMSNLADYVESEVSGLYIPVTVTGLTDSASGNWGNGSSKAQGTYTFRPGDNSNLWPTTAKALHVFVFSTWASASASSIISLRRSSGGTNEAQVRGLVAGSGYSVNVNIALDASGYFYAVIEGADTTSSVIRVLGYYT